jgi:hypothetical protein
MNKILDSHTTLGVGIFVALAGIGTILGGAYGHNFWTIAGGFTLLSGPVILAAFKVRQIYQQYHAQKPKDDAGHTDMIDKKHIVKPGGNTYIPNPSQHEVWVPEHVLAGHAQYNLDSGDEGL